MSDSTSGLEGLREGLSIFMPRAKQEAMKFRKTDLSGLGNINEILEGFQKLLTALYTVSGSQGIPVEPYISRAGNALQELTAALQNKDYIVIADILEYEICAILEDWLQALA